jgi:hypothetical protein
VLLRYEFVLDPDADTDMLEARAVAALGAYGALTIVSPTAEAPAPEADPAGAPMPDVFPRARVCVSCKERLGEIANLTANFLESYLLVLRAMERSSGAVSAKELPRKAQALGKTLLAAEELRMPEALSLSNLDNAVRAFTEEGVLLQREQSLEGVPAEVQQRIRELERLLPREARSV